MEFQVNTNNVILSKINQVESGEYNVTECRFIFSSEYEGLTKTAVFTGANGDAYKITILNNKCEIPSELLTESQIVQIGVYAYEVQGTEFVLRYSPMPTRFMIEKGSYVVNAVNMSRPTPTEVEQLQSQITHNANDIEDLQQTVSEHTTDISNIQSDINDIKAEQTEQNTNIQKNTDDIVNINQAIDTINTDITDIDSAIGDINEDIDNLEQDLTNYSLITETGSQINLNVNSTNYQITAILKDKNGNVIYTSNAIDLPIESMIVNARYDNTTKEIVLTLQNGNTLRISVADLVSGLVSETQLQTTLANYYTKTEVDNLLNEKANQSSLDTTNQNLSNLAGRVSTNEEDIAGIKKEQTTQNTNIEELQSQVETLQEDLESANAEIEELNTDITNMRKAMITVDGQGTDITLPNTSENKFVEFELEGRTEQDGEPTPETPIPIQNVTGNANVKIQNKNLFDNTLSLTGITYSNITDIFTFHRDTGADFIIPYNLLKLKANTKYILYMNIVENTMTNNFQLITNNNSFLQGIFSVTAGETGIKSAQISTRNSTDNLLYDLWFYCTGNGTLKAKVMLEEGTTATSYVPHQEQNYPFTFAEGQFLADNEKLQDNGMYKKYAQVDLSTFTWTQYATNKYTATALADVIKRPFSGSVKGNILAEKYNVVTQNTSFTNGVIALGVGGNLACMDTTGSPTGILQYELKEATTIPYNETQATQYNAMKQAKTYKDITIISSESDELGFNMNVVAVADANKVIDNQNNEIDTIKSRLDLLEG